MGGVDFLDIMMSYYRMTHRTRHWTVRTTIHMMDFAVTTAWIQYRKDMLDLGTPHQEINSDSDFEERPQCPKKSRARVQQPSSPSSRDPNPGDEVPLSLP
ncbi:hypothetical protein HHI36_001237 [Cryptolaemus montrouzieri]|uniref:Uncharacterized protein n=1 Tax=Cryptolaemus montrouzieri TaxID=559131 RepID=A0ABD2P6T8_9CUCU